ncbi:MAG TPA: glycosyltransferase [Acidobacteriaceae bacterium]|nr:glycosyltransferase [Acidobacteriaceae bacterium]
MHADHMGRPARAPQGTLPHICTCVCTFKRPLPLRRLLNELDDQATDGLFTYSIIVADNDKAESGRRTVEEFRASTSVPILYCVEPERGIARTRNRVLSNAAGDYFALIDDDEVPIREWLLHLFKACEEFKTDGILGPVLRRFDGQPPKWLEKSSFFERPVKPTGLSVAWAESRTGNVLLKRTVLFGDEQPFRTEIRAGSDVDFFMRKCGEGFRFTWCAEAMAYELIPPERWTRGYQVRKAILCGADEHKVGSFGIKHIVKSMVAVPLYALLLPFTLLFGQHIFMDYLTRTCEHAARLLSLVGIHIACGAYTAD